MTLKIGVIGTGAIGQEHIHRIKNSLTGAEVVAVNDIDKDHAEEVVKEEGINAVVYDSAEELINSEKVDAVMVTTPGFTHDELVLGAIEAEKPVFCEKPLSETESGAKSIVDAEVNLGKKLVQVGFMRRFDKSYRQLKKFIDDGNIGEALLVHAAHRNPEVDTESYNGNMPITDTLVHELDIFRWLLDDDYKTVEVISGKQTKNTDEKLKDPLMFLMETEEGVRIDVEVFVNCQYGYDIQCKVVGETGIANLPEPMSPSIRKDAKLYNEILTDWKDRFRDSYDVELQEWIDATVEGRVDGPNAWDGYATAVVSDACIEAKEKEEKVNVVMPECPELYK